MTKSFELNKYLGVWHEQGSTPLWFSKGCTNTTANYSIDENGNVNVANRCIVDGKTKVANGKAFKTDEDRLLRVGFFPSKRPIFKAEYRIRYLEGKRRYNTAIVTSGKSVWILTRGKRISEQKYKSLLRKAEGFDIDTNEVKRTR